MLLTACFAASMRPGPAFYPGAMGIPAGVPVTLGERRRRGENRHESTVAGGVICNAAGVIGIVLAQAAGSARLRRWPLVLTFVGAVLSMLRGFAGLVQDIVIAVISRRSDIGVFYDLWFAIAGVVFSSPLVVLAPASVAERVVF